MRKIITLSAVLISMGCCASQTKAVQIVNNKIYNLADKSTNFKKKSHNLKPESLSPSESVARQFQQQIEQAIYGGKLPTTIIADFGATVSIDKYYLPNPEAKPKRQVQQEVDKANADIQRQMQQPDEKHKQQILKGHFPIKPDFISLSTVNKKQILRKIEGIEHNLFVIGDDKYSLDWVKFNKEELKRFGAAGVLTKVESMERYEEIARLVAPLSLLPVQADFISTNFGVNNYPVLITNQGEFR